MTATEYIILVDKNDREIGHAPKLAVHEKGLLHRAFSVFGLRYTSQWEVLLQQRALEKYHSPGLWTNTCCSHPHPGETTLIAATRRLNEELGLSFPLQTLGHFIYRAAFPNGLIEHEFDHVLAGIIPADTIIQPNHQEVMATQWISITTLAASLQHSPEQFTPWLAPALTILKDNLDKLIL